MYCVNALLECDVDAAEFESADSSVHGATKEAEPIGNNWEKCFNDAYNALRGGALLLHVLLHA